MSIATLQRRRSISGAVREQARHEGMADQQTCRRREQPPADTKRLAARSGESAPSRLPDALPHFEVPEDSLAGYERFLAAVRKKSPDRSTR